jgi:hypothetical protein
MPAIFPQTFGFGDIVEQGSGYDQVFVRDRSAAALIP